RPRPLRTGQHLGRPVLQVQRPKPGLPCQAADVDDRLARSRRRRSGVDRLGAEGADEAGLIVGKHASTIGAIAGRVKGAIGKRGTSGARPASTACDAALSALTSFSTREPFELESPGEPP